MSDFYPLNPRHKHHPRVRPTRHAGSVSPATTAFLRANGPGERTIRLLHDSFSGTSQQVNPMLYLMKEAFIISIGRLSKMNTPKTEQLWI